MKNKSGIIWSFMFFIILAGCSSHQQLAGNEPILEPETQTISASSGVEESRNSSAAPCALEDDTGYIIKSADIEIKEGRAYLPMGAEFITQDGKVELGDVIKAMADHKGFSVSWADDVDQQRPVDCYIKAADNYYDALDNILRQLDYYYEIDEDTIVIKYKETKRYQLAIPNFSDKFDTSLGGDMLGGQSGESTGMEAKATLSGSADINFWDDLQAILAEIIQCDGCPAASIDRNLGIITVRAPRRIQDEIKDYLNLLAKESYKQVVVEAKIIEVVLTEGRDTGIDWENVFGGEGLGVNAGVTPDGQLWSRDEGWDRFLNTITLDDTNWDLAIHAFETYGDVRIMANPKVHILNGRSALINVTKNREYVSEIEVTIQGDPPTTSTDVTTSEISEGLSMAVKVNILSDDEVMLYIFPTVARLLGDFTTFDFGEGQVQLADTAVRQMSTYAKVKNDQFLVVGGLIDETEETQTKQLPILGGLPYIGKFFSYEKIVNESTELVIVLKPRILSGQVAVTSLR